MSGANITVVDTALGSIADPDGRFSVNRVAVGTYRLQIWMVGYRQRIRSGIVVRSNHITAVEVSP